MVEIEVSEHHPQVNCSFRNWTQAGIREGRQQNMESREIQNRVILDESATETKGDISNKGSN